ncbi:MAG: acyl-CoA dehydrogenase, partial [Candidatus Microthrix parvicella]|nr:acyl-CoA dehydrogenase [Candidatus Microthrix parvicella]
MRFAFEDEQLELAAAVRDLLSREVPAERVREAWESEDGRLRDVWAKLADMGVLGLMVPEAHGGLGFSEEEMVLALTECGRVGLPDPVLSSAMVVAPLLAEVIAQDSAPSGAAPLAGTWLERLPGGATAVPAFPAARTVAFANSADVIVGYADGELHVVDPTSVRLSPERSVDGARKLSRLSWEAHPDTLLAQGEAARAMIRNAWNRAALGTAAQLLGLGETMLDMTVGYVSERKQF